ncbi:MAG: histidine phosphatase family protein [Planctomycetota bacterium]|nr:histidine phosphatase family protein [Planctomycetota bacterium]
MKTLLILRHAKSSWDLAGQADHERPLNPRGQRAAPRMGTLLRDEQLVPDHIISSTACRARQTVEALVSSSGFCGITQWENALYLAPPDVYRTFLQQLSTDPQRVLVVGHNPGLEDLILQLTGRHETMPTAALAQVTLPIDSWEELNFLQNGELTSHWQPRNLPPESST